MMNADWNYHRGDVYFSNLGENNYPFEQEGRRPVIVMQNQIGCISAPTLTVVPMTSALKRQDLNTHYVLKDAKFLPRKSMVIAEQIRTISKDRIICYMGRIDRKDMLGCEEAIRAHLGYDLPEAAEAP